MVDTKTGAATASKAAAPKTPQPDSPDPATHPKKGRRFRLSKEGDYCVMEVAPPGGSIPQGCYIPIPDTPDFIDKREALKFIDNAGDLLGGKAVVILRVYAIGKLEAHTTTVVQAHWKPMVQVAGPPETENA